MRDLRMKFGENSPIKMDKCNQFVIRLTDSDISFYKFYG